MLEYLMNHQELKMFKNQKGGKCECLELWLFSCRNGKRGQGWERKYVLLDGYKVITYETEPRDGL